MTPISNISIPETCNQPWQQMTPADNGRHCEQCSKIVVDFTKMTNDEIISYLATKGSVCGRFNERQLYNVNSQLHKTRQQSEGGLSKWLMAAALLAFTVFNKTSGQVKPTQPQTIEQGGKSESGTHGFPLGKIAVSSIHNQVISGCVTDGNNKAIADAMVRFPSGAIAAQTDINGNFKVLLPLSIRELIISRLGFMRKSINVGTGADTLYHVKLIQEKMLLGDVVIIKPPLIKRVYNKFVDTPIRKIFK